MFFHKTTKKFISGNQAVIEGAKAAGANCMCGYPITPVTEILEEWARLHDNNPQQYKFIQAEDETSAGFNTIGAILAGAKAFTATAGPGNILMQDPITMAEAMRIPFVGIVMQRGGPSTGTVIFGQQEVNLTAFGGNGEGLRVVYSICSPQEAYWYTIRAFNTAWQGRFPTFVLGDGYVARMKTEVKLDKPRLIVKSKAILGDDKITNLRNCYNFEDQLADKLTENIHAWQKFSQKIVESEKYLCRDAEVVFVGHGITWLAIKEAVDYLRRKNIKVGAFRPITLRPLDYHSLSEVASKVGKMFIIESSLGQLERLVKDKIYGLTKIEVYQKPAMPISKEEIINLIK